MPDEPNNQIDGLLKAWAKKRRDEAGAPLDLHPATRKLLQVEVARTFPQKNSPTPRRSTWLTILWPRGAFALGVFIVLAVAVVSFWPGGNSSRTSQFAKNEAPGTSLDRERDVALKQDAPRPVAESLATDKDVSDRKRALDLADAVTLKSEVRRVDAGGVALSRQKEAVIEQSAREAKQMAGAKPVAAPAPTFEKQKAFTDRESGTANFEKKPAERQEPLLAKSNDGLQRANENAPAGGRNFKTPVDQPLAPAQTPPASTLALQAGDTSAATAFFAEAQNGAATEKFYRAQAGDEVARRGLKDARAAEVLAAFSFTQTAEGVQIVDGDGSVYKGQLQPVTTTAGAVAGDRFEAGKLGVLGDERNADKAVKLRAAKPVSQPAGLSQNAPSTTQGFRVSGTNRSLQQLVEFTGNYVTTNALPVSANGAGGFGGNANFAPANAPMTPAQSVSRTAAPAGENRARAGINQVARQSLNAGTPAVTPASISSIQGVVRIGGTNEIKVNAVRQPAGR